MVDDDDSDDIGDGDDSDDNSDDDRNGDKRDSDNVMMAMTVVMIVKMSMMTVTQNIKDKINNDNIIDYIDDDNDDK